ncbi:MAG TPA: cytidylate kinase-like family protein [bacterium]|jgi:cytidylate kinase
MAQRLVDAYPSSIEHRLDTQLSLAARIRSHEAQSVPKTAPFITLSRQYGCEAIALAEALMPRLAEAEGLSGERWQMYSRQILETMASQEHLSSRLIEALDVHTRSNIEEFFDTLLGKSPPDIRVLKHLVRTERALASIGHCIIIGRGGVLLTAGLPGGMHVRLIAPEAWRLSHLVKQFGWDERKAQDYLHEEESGRHSFFHKYLGQDENDPLHYDLILNVAHLGREEQVAAILGLFNERLPKKPKL